MHCPFCQHSASRVIDSRVTDRGTTIRRRRECESCGGRFTTMERCVLLVVKRNGVTEEFSREKVINGVRRACQGRDVSDDALKRLAQEVENSVRTKGSSQVNANEIGLAILEPLRRLDEVAYLRFASVYKGFEDASDFEREIRSMRRKNKGEF
ncbi:MAG: transcriptional regulator NrdR [Corynebacterium sp.]|nr:transcriptional regulator NrdR [Corynebacterium sp.]